MNIRGGPLENYGKGGWGWGIFEPQEFFSLANSLYYFFLGRSKNIFCGKLACIKFFRLIIFPCANVFFVLRLPPPISFIMVRPFG